MNFFVHALMYSYYACRALKIRIPRPIAMTITALQLSQMFVGVWVQFYIYSVRKDPECPTHYYNLRAAVIMYGSYYLLFAQFFIKAYGYVENIEFLKVYIFFLDYFSNIFVDLSKQKTSHQSKSRAKNH